MSSGQLLEQWVEIERFMLKSVRTDVAHFGYSAMLENRLGSSML
jgi:hypothetical protein